ncbi:MAG: DUF3307 domain-containing protein [Anaerolineae bacterium]|nr:DUF3307 domain-containing protein [Anaerolineae bacterium]
MFYRLLLAHLVGDFVLQTRWMVLKKRTPSGLAAHVAVVTLTMLPVAWVQLDLWWPWLLVIAAIHAGLDAAKVYLEPRLHVPPIIPFLVDQALHILTLAAVAIVAEPGGALVGAGAAEPVWWIASVYLVATFALSIALPLWLDPASLMHRPAAARWTVMVASALVLTLAWRGWPAFIPVAGIVLYHLAAQRLGRRPVTTTFPVEFWAAISLTATLGWSLR